MAELTIKVGNTEFMFEGTPEELAELAKQFKAKEETPKTHRELAFAKAGRKLDEFKKGDIVRYMGGSTKHRETVTEALAVSDAGVKIAWYDSRASTERRENIELIAPSESRVDGV